MAKAPKKKKSKNIGNPVTNPRGKLGQTVATWIAARTLTPALSHIASLPGRLGIGVGLDDETTKLPSRALVPSRRFGVPPAGLSPQPNRSGAPPYHAGTIHIPSATPEPEFPYADIDNAEIPRSVVKLPASKAPMTKEGKVDQSVPYSELVLVLS